MFSDTIPEEDGFQRDPDEPDIKELQRFLGTYGLTATLKDIQNEEGKLLLSKVAEKLPEQDDNGPNAAKKEIQEYLEAMPPMMKSGGVYMEPKKMLSMLMRRTEFFDDLARDVVRVCTGTECEHYSECPFKEYVGQYRAEDRVPCAVDRNIVKGAIKEFIDPEGGQGTVDPNRTGEMMYFRQLVFLLVRQKRLQMTLRKEDLMQEYEEILQMDQTGREEFRSGNYTVHPLVEAMDKTHKRIEQTLDKMAAAPKFQVRHDLYETENEALDPDELAQKRMLEEIENSLNRIQESSTKEELQEEMSREKLLEEALEDIQNRNDEQTDIE